MDVGDVTLHPRVDAVWNDAEWKWMDDECRDRGLVCHT